MTEEQIAEINVYAASHPAAQRLAPLPAGLSVVTLRPKRGLRKFFSSLHLLLTGRKLVDSGGRTVPLKWW